MNSNNGEFDARDFNAGPIVICESDNQECSMLDEARYMIKHDNKYICLKCASAALTNLGYRVTFGYQPLS